jgi:hypothetical protein
VLKEELMMYGTYRLLVPIATQVSPSTTLFMVSGTINTIEKSAAKSMDLRGLLATIAPLSDGIPTTYWSI